MDSPLRTERKKRKWSQSYVGSKVGLSAPQISRIESGGVKDKYVLKIQKLVELFGYSLTFDQICSDPNTTKEESSEAA